MPYKFKVYCPVCYQNDPEGCFAGHSELSEIAYPTEDEAALAGQDFVNGTTWKFDVVEWEYS